MEALIYIAQVSLYWLLLYACYWLVLRQHTFFRWNRSFLLGSLLAAFVLPLVQYPDAAPTLPVVYEMPTFVVDKTVVPSTAVVESPAPSAVTGTDLLWVLYLAGVLFMGGRLLHHFHTLFTYIKKGVRLPVDRYTLVLTENNDLGSFSFLNYIVVGRSDYEHHFDTILNHELVHVRQRHSLDILLVEVLRVLFWFNPVLILYKKSLQQVHEYLADQHAPNRDRYASFLVAYALNTPLSTLTNHFFTTSLLKDRIKMLYKNRNSRWSLGKYAVVVAIVGLVTLTASSFKPGKSPVVTENSQRVQIEGIVVDADGHRIEGVTVLSENKRFRTFTDTEGQYLIQVPAGSKLTFELEGYKSISLRVTKWQVVNATLMQAGAPVSSTVALSPSEEREDIYAEPVRIGEFRFIPVLWEENNSADYTNAEEVSPRFPGGAEALSTFISQHATYPSEALRPNAQGKVLLDFLVSSNGEINDIEVLKGPGFGLEATSAQLVASMPAWVPGQKDGRKVAMRYHLSVDWQLGLDPDKTGTVESQVEVGDEKASHVTVKYYKAGNRRKSMGYYRNYRGSHLPENALYVLNGTLMKNKEFMNEIPTEQYKSVTVLSGATAKELYGEKAVNGAVLILTKNEVKKP
ncbi:M56 family metallopeptidase [Telluribacter sp.]|jgi:hypothetical protein|uniref:M56 family metallopeptidase n=1 Tax=Telluribacter sp. TaxID=1978767 RepID=UPI002E11431D|nr:M56 family metallopeptidase [Telluribacter sp.]